MFFQMPEVFFMTWLICSLGGIIQCTDCLNGHIYDDLFLLTSLSNKNLKNKSLAIINCLHYTHVPIGHCSCSSAVCSLLKDKKARKKLVYSISATSQENLLFAYAKNKPQINCMVTVHL